MPDDSVATHACPRCAHENDADTHFCGNCGLNLDGLCPRCQTQNEHSTHFCATCGYDFAMDAEPAPTPAAEQSAPSDLRTLSASWSESTPQPAPTQPTRTVECPRCHRVNEPGAAFCYNCGLPFDDASGFPEGQYSSSAIPAYVGAKPGGFWIRVLAYIIDSLIVQALVSLLVFLLTDQSPTQLFAFDALGNPVGWGWGEFIDIIISFTYAPVLLGYYGTTVGKRVFNMYVVRVDGTKISFLRAVGRELSKVLSSILFIGFLMVAFRQDKRGLHDLIAETVVVVKR